MKLQAMSRVLVGITLLSGFFQGAGAAADQKLGAAAPGEAIDALFLLKTNENAVERWANAVNDPESPRYGRFLTIEQIRARFAAKSESIRWVTGFLKSKGLKPLTDATGLYLKVRLTAEQVTELTGSSLFWYRDALTQRTYLKTDPVPRVPDSLMPYVEGIAGLDRTQIHAIAPQLSSKPTTRQLVASALSSSAYQGPYVSPLKNMGTPSGCPDALATTSSNTWPTEDIFSTHPYTPNQWLSAYGVTELHQQGLSGAGERLALIEMDGFDPNDIATFNACFGIPNLTVYPHTHPYGPLLDPGMETTLDLEMISPTAHGLDRIDIWESTDGNGHPDSSFTALAATFKAAVFEAPKAERPSIVSISLGGCEAQGSVNDGHLLFEKFFRRAALAGVSVFVSTGDNGVTPCRTMNNLDSIDQSGFGIQANLITVNYPSSSPWVIAVGGTNALLNPDNSMNLEQTWNDPDFFEWIQLDKIQAPLMQARAGTGGVSQLFLVPKWQQPLLKQDSQGISTRMVPDVALLADTTPGYVNYGPVPSWYSLSGRTWYAVGGTSAGAPFMAAATALMKQSLRVSGKTSVGFMGPTLYKLGLESQNSTVVFNDVTTGDINTTWETPLGGYDPMYYSADKGFDLASGWGSPRFPQMLDALKKMKKKK